MPTDDPDKPPTDPAQIASYWQLQLEMSENARREWRDNARKIVQRYKSEKDMATKRTGRRLNILYSNTETLRAALYGKAAQPDVRRRFGDQDLVARQAAEVIERALVYCAETYDVDKPLEAGILDYLLPGRGVVRIEYEPTLQNRPSVNPMTGMPATDESGAPVMEEFIADQTVREVYVYWDDFLWGPAREWAKVPWISFRHQMDRDELIEAKFQDAANIPLNWQPEMDKRRIAPDSLKKAEVFEIWNLDDRKRYWIIKGWDKPGRVDPDPYGLQDFWPMPEPLNAYLANDDYIPTPEFQAYSDQADDLDEIVARISRLTRALRRRGVYDQGIKELKRLANAGDNEFIPVENYAALSAKGGLQASFQSEDISVIAGVLVQLYQQRDMLIQAIYEVTGIADIMRGASDPGETLGAQQLKAQFGSTRMKRRQRAVQKWIRDLYKLKAEIIAEHFEPQVLQEMTGDQVTPDVMALLRSDKLRSYRIDIETDSTIFQDETQEKQNRTEMVGAVSKFMQVWGPMVQQQPRLLPLAFELMSFALQPFKPSKGIEDTIEQTKQQLGQMAQQQAANPQPSPEQMNAQAEQDKQKMEMAHTQQEHANKMQQKGADLMVDVAKAQMKQATTPPPMPAGVTIQ